MATSLRLLNRFRRKSLATLAMHLDLSYGSFKRLPAQQPSQSFQNPSVIRQPCFPRRPRYAAPNRTDTSFDTPGSCMVTP